ncbi:MAG: hypothetical protein PVI20_09825 [Desulfobacteraceae bacterium]|jgi:hypothetical protein
MSDSDLLAQALEPFGIKAQQSPSRVSLTMPDGQGFEISATQDIDDEDEAPLGRSYLIVERRW